MEATLNKWGNGQGILISKRFCDALGVKVGDKVDVEEADGQITIRPVRRRFHRTQKVTVAELFDGWNGTYEPPSDWPTVGNEIDWGEPVGKEMW